MIPDGKTRVIVTLDDGLLAKIDEWCKRNDMTRSGFFTYVGEVAFSADSTISDVLTNAFVKQALKLAIDEEVSARLAALDRLDAAAGRVLSYA